jgi:predicted RNA-binding Zn ribbon-like protein
MTEAYTGPLRDEPLAIELHNTLYAAGGIAVDGLADAAQARAWLDGVAARLPLDDYPPGAPPAVDQLVVLRGAVRTALHAALDDVTQEPTVLEAINRASARAPWSPVAELQPSGLAERRSSYHGATREDAVIAAFARDAIDLITGPVRDELRACGAPGCVLMFLREHARREWCSNACGNRARQARHYARVRPRTQPAS